MNGLEAIHENIVSPSAPQPAPPTLHFGTQNIGGYAQVHNGNVIQQVIQRALTFESRSRNDILKWLSPLSFQQTHERIRDKALLQDKTMVSLNDDYTGKWLLESDVFDRWQSREICKLWYHGMRK
jgi:hypothetical protein